MYNEKDIEILSQYGYSIEQLVDLSTVPAHSLTAAFVREIEEDILNPDNPFRVSPFQLFLVKNAPPNARAIAVNGRYVLVIHHSVLELAADAIYRKFPKILPPGNKLSSFIEKHINQSLSAFIFQMISLYIYEHELAHLNQYKNKNITNGQLQDEYDNLIAGSDFDPISHAMEIDADLFAASFVAIRIFGFWSRLPLGERSTDLLTALIAVFGAAIFLFWYTMQGGWSTLYFLESTHPHILIRVTYILDCMTSVFQSKGNSSQPFSRDQCQLEAFLLAEQLLRDPNDHGFIHYWTLFQENIDAFEEYTHKHMTPISKQLPYLVQWNWLSL